MPANAIRRMARTKLACALLATAGAAAAGQLGADVTVKVRLVTSSGACGAVATAPAIGVACQHPERRGAQMPAGPLLPDPGTVPYQRVGTIQAPAVVAQPLPLYSDGTKIASWRVVTLDNARYVELTIAW